MHYLALPGANDSNEVCPIYSKNYAQGCKSDSRFAPSQSETSLQSNAVSHWLGASLESALRLAFCCASFVVREHSAHIPWGYYVGDWWIPLTKGQWCGKRFHGMTSSKRVHILWDLPHKGNDTFDTLKYKRPGLLWYWQTIILKCFPLKKYVFPCKISIKLDSSSSCPKFPTVYPRNFHHWWRKFRQHDEIFVSVFHYLFQ